MEDKDSTREEKNGENRENETKKDDRELQSKNQGKAETKKLQSSSSNGGEGSSSEAAEADDSAILLKCPPSVAGALASSSATSAGAPVAEVVLTINPLDPQPLATAERTFKFLGDQHGNADAHHSYSLRSEVEGDTRMVAFSDTKEGEVSAVGAVRSKLLMTPLYRSDDERTKHWKETAAKANVQRRQTKMIHLDNKGKPVESDSMTPGVKLPKAMGSQNRVLEMDQEGTEIRDEEEEDLNQKDERELKNNSNENWEDYIRNLEGELETATDKEKEDLIQKDTEIRNEEEENLIIQMAEPDELETDSDEEEEDLNQMAEPDEHEADSDEEKADLIQMIERVVETDSNDG